MSVDRLKMPVAGPHNAPVPAPEYNYEGGISIAVTTSVDVGATAIPAGTYRINVDTDVYFKCAADPTFTAGNKDTSGIDFAAAGSCWHETFDGLKKIATLGKSAAGIIRLIPIVKVAG